MPLTLQARPDCTSSLLNHSRRPSAPSCCPSQFASSRRLLTNLPLPTKSLTSGSIVGARRLLTNLSFSAKSLTSGSIVGRRLKASKHDDGMVRNEEEEEKRGGGSRELVQQHCRELTQGRVDLKAAVMMAGLVGLQVCLPAFAENLGLAEAAPNSDFQSGFSSAFLLIFFSEIGDKTFFIAALLATRKSNLAVFSGTFGALAAMTVISVTLGRAFHYLDDLIPATQFPLDDLAAVVLLVYFGVSTLADAASMEGSTEKEDAELAIAGIGNGNLGFQAAAATFALVFVAEWGDKSFFSTIALAAASSPGGVVTGAIAGHGVATVLAVLGGSFLSEYISEKLIAYVGGVLFLVFAATTLIGILK